MKKTLFAMLALATMMPAMADTEYWYMDKAYTSIYDNDKNLDHYSLYLITYDSSDITTVKTEVASQTLTQFIESVSGSYAFTEFYAPKGGKLRRLENDLTSFPTTIPYDNIWGVCVYQAEDVAQFQVIGSIYRNPVTLDIGSTSGVETGYTSFKADSPATPEPATATLSLLALAGLATRRRRK